MAKNQDLTLNFSKLNGVCGQLKCCLQYEDDVYREKRARLPKEGDIISTHTGETGRVDRLHLLSEQFVMMTIRGVRKRFVVDLYKETLDKETANFPKEFDMITDETHKVVGLDEKETKKIKAFEAEVKTYKEKGKSFADGIFESLFGEKSLDYSLPAIEELESNKPRVKTPDEEEELTYTMSEDEILPEDEEEDIVDHEPVRTRVDLMDRGSQSGRSDNRQGPQAPRGDNRGPRQDNRGPRPQGQQNRGPRPQGQDNRGPRPQGQDNRGPRPQGQSNQNRPQGGGQQGQNQGRNRPPR